MARAGRPQRPYRPSWGGDPIHGLYRRPDGRWRIIATGKEYSDPDEASAIRRFYEMTGQARLMVPIAKLTPGNLGSGEASAILASNPNAELMLGPSLKDEGQTGTKGGQPRHLVTIDIPASNICEAAAQAATIARTVQGQKIHIIDTTSGRIIEGFGVSLPEAAFASMCAEWINLDRSRAARMTGLPGLADPRIVERPRPPLLLENLIDVYREQSPASARAKRATISAFRRLITHSGAKTADDLPTGKLLAFRQLIETDPSIESAGTRRAIYGRIKSIIAFGLKVGMDEQQINAALGRCKVLWTADPMPPVNPKPITRTHFHALLAADNAMWRAWLLLGLNLCLHIDEVCGLRWPDFDLEAGTYAAIRPKTRRERIPRAAVLWPETTEAMSAISRKGEYVFISTHGTRYNRNTRINDFADLRRKAGLPEHVTFDMIRDGAYTAACQGTTDERWARVLAGHKAAGLQDNYVLRNPAMVKPACDAVYRAYGPFPTPEA